MFLPSPVLRCSDLQLALRRISITNQVLLRTVHHGIVHSKATNIRNVWEVLDSTKEKGKEAPLGLASHLYTGACFFKKENSPWIENKLLVKKKNQYSFVCEPGHANKHRNKDESFPSLPHDTFGLFLRYCMKYNSVNRKLSLIVEKKDFFSIILQNSLIQSHTHN